MNNPDAIFFDLDGTLRDGVDAYVNGFNDYFLHNKIERSLTRNDLIKYLGVEEKQFLEAIFPWMNPEERTKAYMEVVDFIYLRIQRDGGKLYEGVITGLKELAKFYQLFIVSNCAEFTIKHFVEWANISNLFTDPMAHGENYKSKHRNIAALMKGHSIKQPVYVGDTESDGEQCSLLNIPFVYVTYGFGAAKDYNYKFDSFNELETFFLSIKNKN